MQSNDSQFNIIAGSALLHLLGVSNRTDQHLCLGRATFQFVRIWLRMAMMNNGYISANINQKA